MAPNLKHPLFSIVIPAYNAEKHIANAIRSVISQSFEDWELIIVDDGSNDRTRHIVADLAKDDSRINLISQSNLRQGAARNTGIKSAKGKWIAFLDADDLWLPHKLLHQSRILNDNPGVSVIYGDGYTKYDNVPFKIPYHLKKEFGLISGLQMYQLLIFNNCIPVLSATIKKQLICEVGLFDENKAASGCEDHDLWLRAAKDGALFLGSEERCFIYNMHSENFSSNYFHQNFSSAYIRLKNLDKNLLTDDQIKKFAAQIKQVIKFLRKNNQTDLEAKLRQLFKNAGLKNQSYFRANTIIDQLKFNVKLVLIKLLKFAYFPIKKNISRFNNRVASEYQKWLHHDLLVLNGPLTLSPTAKIDFFRRRGKVHSYGLQIGDYSSINIVTEHAELITGGGIMINKFCNFNISGQVFLGNNVLFNNYSSLNCFEKIEIGDNTWFGEGVRLYDHNHQYKNTDTPFTSQGYNTGRIKIGSNVWIGSNTIILQNVEIGDNCVIGANNIIFKSIPSDTIIKSGKLEHINRKK